MFSKYAFPKITGEYNVPLLLFSYIMLNIFGLDKQPFNK